MTLEGRLRALTGLGLAELAARTVGCDRSIFIGARIAAVSNTSGLGVISGFAQAVATTLRHLGCDAWTADAADAAGISEAIAAGAAGWFIADDEHYRALDASRRIVVDNDWATAAGFVTALDLATGGLRDRRVLVIGLGRIGMAVARRLQSAGALVLVSEPAQDRREAALAELPLLETVSLAVGLSLCDYVVDACPAPDIIAGVLIRSGMIAVAPGIPSAFTMGAQRMLGVNYLHDRLALGTAVMAAHLLSELVLT